ncbi:MAG: hypothetical protein ACREB0_12665, partial [Sphingopyxis sp.]
MAYLMRGCRGQIMALIFGAAVAALLAASSQSAAAVETNPPTEAVPASAVEPAIAPLVLKRDTPVHFMVVSEVTTKTHT